MRAKFQGKEVEAVDIGFLIRKEDFNEYQLEDGSVIKIKTVVTRILKITGEQDQDGNQVYQVQSSPVMRVWK